MATQNRGNARVYIGTYTWNESEGIYVYRLDNSSGALTYESKAIGLENPTYLAIEPQGRYLYAVSEIHEFDGQPGGVVSAFEIEPATGEPRYINRQPSGGAEPCHLSVDSTGRYVLVANYTGGSVAVFPIRETGELGEICDLVHHAGFSVNEERQTSPHPHSVMIDPTNRYVFVPDLGIDKIMIYKLDLVNGKLTPNAQTSIQVQAGAGPRHFDFHPNLQYAYLINELDCTLCAFAYDESSGALKEIQSISTLPDDFDGVSHCADVHVHPSGKFVYGSNRGHDSIAMFKIAEGTGKLTYLGCESTRGRTPRNFAVDSAGHYLYAANLDSDNIVTFQIDEESGRLTSTGKVVEAPTASCLKIVSR
ncbi:MAG: lactonase family protein [Candidatus Poribacteria bacterium]|nr:lactonase family protein [Candidatus Poribacteria bacterium]MDE0506573.1 lactonase family protein [Candidatus Poribacteria bacterium]